MLIFLFVLQSLISSAQNAAGLWTGRFTTTSMLQQNIPYRYELLLFQEGSSLTGYSYSTAGTGDFYAVCEIKGNIYDGYMVINEKKTLYQNPPSPDGVMQSHILFFSADNKEATGEWKQTNKSVVQLLAETGKTFLKKEEDPSKSNLIKILERKNTVKVDDGKTSAQVNQDSVKLASRPKNILQTIILDTDSVTIELYDDGLIDGDSVSVFINNSMLLNKVGLTDKTLKETIRLPVSAEGIILTMFAENEGSIPPNTGLLIIRSGEAKHEIRFSSDTKKSAAIELRRK